VLRCWALVCAWAGTGVPDGRAAGRADGCLRARHASPTPGSRESRWNSSRQCRLLCVASGWVSRCEAVGEMARGLRHAGELLAATICASLRAARGPRVCGASGARPRSRFTGGRSFGRPAASQQDPADVCKPGSSVANSTVCVRVRVPAQMQRCVGLPGVGRPAGDAFRRRACPRALLRTDPDQNRYFKVYPTGLWRSPQILKVEFWKARIWLSVWLSVW
jgi:hypothetical protein